jgi:hypothetical protein
MSPESARQPPSPSLATDVVRKAMSLVNVRMQTLPRVVATAAVAEATLDPAAKSATSVARSDTLLATVLKVVTAAGVMVVDSAVVVVLVVVVLVDRHATPAAVSVTCLETARKARSAITVRETKTQNIIHY